MYAKTICSWVRKDLSMAKTQMSLGILQGTAASAALVAGFYCVGTMLAGDWARVFTTARHYFSTNVTTTDSGSCTACCPGP